MRCLCVSSAISFRRPSLVALPRRSRHCRSALGSVHEIRRVEVIHDALAAKDLLPGEHLADAAYIDARLLFKVH